MHERTFELVPLIYHVSPTDSFKVERIEGVAAIFGPSSSETSGIVASIAESVEVPHLTAFWERESTGGEGKPTQMTLNMYPDNEVLSRAYAELLIDYTWKSYTIIYENDDGLIRLKDVLQIHDPQSPPVTVRQLEDGPDYRPLLKEIQSSGESHIILDVSPDKIVTLLRQAAEVKMMEEYQSYIITSLETHTLDYEELKFMRANITAMRMIDPTSFEVMNAINDWEQGERQHRRNFHITPEKVLTETALYHDSVRLFATAVQELESAEDADKIEAKKMNCKHPTPWEQGSQLVNYMRLKADKGISGEILFNEQGKRSHFHLEITELSKEGFKKIGTWDPVHGVNYTRTLGEAYDQIVESLQNKTFIVASRIGAPFLMWREVENGVIYEGNHQWEGFSMDLIDAISKILHFHYRFELVPDGKYGSYNKVTKQWDGLVKHLLDRKADLAICDLTITYERRTAVDFTMPFMTLVNLCLIFDAFLILNMTGISILFSKPVKQPPDLFSFLSPLSVEVWVFMLAAYLGVSVMLFVLARIAPDDWEASHPCNQEAEELENIWNMHNCIWLTMGSIMGQGCDILPKGLSTRIITGMWWFFALIMLASYTANLAAFLTMERMDATIDNAEDLAKQSRIKYGAVKGGSTMKFFQDSNFSTYQRMWATMESTRPSVFTTSNDEGRERVAKSKRQYAFLMESTSLEYITERSCDLTQIGGLLDSKGYGIALPLNSPYRTAISGAVLKLQEEGKLSTLKEKWWKGGKCRDESSSGGGDDAAELGIANVGGVFLVLGFGCLSALIVAIIEFLWNVKKVAVEEKLTPWEALKAELLFAVNISIVTKPVHNRLSESESSKSTRRSQRFGSETRSTLRDNQSQNCFTQKKIKIGFYEEKLENFCGVGKSRSAAMKFYRHFIVFVLFCIIEVKSQPKRVVTVGGIFHGDDDISQIAFKHAIERINSRSTLYQIVPMMFNISRTDSFKAQTIVCQLASEGVDVIFGPSSVETSGIVASIAEKFEIPHIIFHWKTKPLYWEKSVEHTMTLNLYPDSNALAEAYGNVLSGYSWKSYTIVYENKESLIRLKDVLQVHDSSSLKIEIRKLDDRYGSILKEIRARGDVNIVLDIGPDKIVPFLTEAASVKMLGDYNNYFITNLDTHTLDISQVQNRTANITCIRLVDINSDELINALRVWRQREYNFNMDEKQVPHEAALVHDAVQLYFNGLQSIGHNYRFQKTTHNCSEPRSGSKSNFGFQLINFLKNQEFDGATGKVVFNNILPNKGGRTEFRIEILEMVKDKFISIGHWDTTEKVVVNRIEEELDMQRTEAMHNKTFKIISKWGEPFLMPAEAPDGTILEGNARFKGYVPRLIKELQKNMGFKFVLEVVPDGEYGSLNKETKKWNGLVKHLLDRKADLAVADLTITYERKTAVDFTMPFMGLGIGILFVKPAKKETNLFSFLDPFDINVWKFTGAAYLSVSVLIFILSRINRDDWEPAHPCMQEPEEVESIWNILNCVWLAMGSIMGQGCDILPKGSTTRIVTGMWYFFALIMLASYTANLAAFLTMDRMDKTIGSAEDLAKQVKIKYGAVKGGSTMRFFQESNFSTYQRMWAAMETNGDDSHTTSNQEGVARVLKDREKYAFMMESVPMQYAINKECDLKQVGELLDSKGYGIALPMDSPWRKAFSEQILALSEKGVLDQLKREFWKKKNDCGETKTKDELGIENVGGVFYVLAYGCLIAFIVALAEFLWNVEKIAVQEKITPWDALKSELAFVLKFFITTKPVRSKSSELISGKSSPPRSLKTRSRYGSESRSLKNKSTRSLIYDDSNSKSLLNLN
ncbi:CLUMA_CG017927, isoform A [Clunio marinus]|uniref:Glutamate receptor 1 n=1 Tax=Clunio marinus TaxID=568069 RepID=A0A1J1IX76_9DIPT|nr:CLUMA_CG017927, isoform A [Clunio marinus]